MSDRVAPTDWVWHGMAGHFCCSDGCCFRLHTVVGGYRVSTVGCYHPAGDERGKPREIGCNRLYETMVFHVDDEGPSHEIDSEGYNTEEDARVGHVRMCEKWSSVGHRATRIGALKRIRRLVDRQAEDEGLWFIAETAPEAYLQQELRRLHAVIESVGHRGTEG